MAESELGTVLTVLRIIRGMNQEELAQASGLRSGTISDQYVSGVQGGRYWILHSGNAQLFLGTRDRCPFDIPSGWRHNTPYLFRGGLGAELGAGSHWVAPHPAPYGVLPEDVERYQFGLSLRYSQISMAGIVFATAIVIVEQVRRLRDGPQLESRGARV